MPTRQEYLAEVLRRLGSYRQITVSLDPDTSDSAAQRKIISSDLYDIDRTSPSLNDVYTWVGRYNEGRRIRRQTFTAVPKAILKQPNASYTLTLYGYGTTSSIDPLTATSGSIQTLIRAISSNLTAVTVGGSGPFTIGNLPSASVSLEMTTAGTGGSVSQGMASVEVNRAHLAGLPLDTPVILSTKIPIESDNGIVGVTELITEAMKRLWFIDLLHFTSSDALSDQLTYEISALYPWLKTRNQIIRAYSPVEWEYVGTYTVPLTSHTLSLDIGIGTTVTTSSFSGSASAGTIQTALQTLLSTNEVQGTVTVTGASTTRTITITNTLFADIVVTVSTAAVVTETREQIGNRRWADGMRLRYNGELLEIEWDFPWNRAQTWYLEVYRPTHTWVCRQLDWQTVGTTWTEATDEDFSDLDQFVTDVAEVASIAHYLACRQLTQQASGQETRFWKSEQQRAAMIAAWVKSLDLPTSHEPGFKDEGLFSVRDRDSKGFFSSQRWR